MPPDEAGRRWADLQRVVDGALDLPPDARAAYLGSACGDDLLLRHDAERLLDACERAASAEGLLAGSAATFAAPLMGREPTDALREALRGRYEIERELGRGGMATVYLARDLRHDRTVALKVLARHLGPIGAERFLHEIRIAARLTHPHVLGVHDSGEAAGFLYYVMPYVQGETLRARLERERTLPIREVERLVRELAEALTCAHGAGIVHRDLKPENVLLSAGHAVVADFGIAKAIAMATQGGSMPEAGLTGTGMSLGTPAYMAPEQAVGGNTIDSRADLYALGVIAYEALSGSHPFGDRPPQALVAAHLTEVPEPVGARRTDTPPALAALVMRLLAKSPEDRPESAAAVLRALDAVASPIEAMHGVRRPPGRRMVMLAAAAILVLGVAGYVISRRAPGSDDRVADRASVVSGGVAGNSATLRSVAVLPFENTGGDPSDDYFSDGLTDELAHALARVPGLRLAGRTSSYAFKGKRVAPQEIGRALGVGAIVNGTVRRAGGRLRVRAQLENAGDGTVMWDSVYESRSSDVFEVQDELTRAIVAALAPTLAGGTPTVPGPITPERGTRDQEAYDLYLKGRYHVHERGTANLTRAIAYYQRAINRDPAFARAHAGLALVYGILPSYVPNAADSTMPLMVASAERAVRLDSSLADAHLALGIASGMRLDLAAAMARLRTAIALEPANPFAYHVYGMLLLSAGEIDAAIDTLSLASQLDPLAKSALSAHAGALADAGRFAEAEAVARRVLALDSAFPIGRWALGYIQAFGGEPDSAVRTLERTLELHPDHPGQRALLAYSYAAAGRWSDAERLRAELRARGGETNRVEAAVAELVFGNREPLVRLLATADGARSWNDIYPWFGCHRLLDPIRSDPRFLDAMQRLGVAPCSRPPRWRLPSPR